jgi:redox-sensing transcriptional repressor
MKKNLPGKTVERLSEYRRTLINSLEEGKEYVFSHELAALHNNTAVQVRRDIMLIGYSGVQRRGYKIKELIEAIGRVLDDPRGQNVAIVGVGHLGTAILHYLKGKRPTLFLKALFDVDEKKTGRELNGIPCYHIDDLERVIKKKNIEIGILTVPMEVARETTVKLVDAGVRGLMNFTTIPLDVPEGVYLEEYDLITSLEKVAYFARS